MLTLEKPLVDPQVVQVFSVALLAGRVMPLAGLILALLRRVPQAGDRIVFGGWLFEVLEMDGRRVVKVRASREKLAEA